MAKHSMRYIAQRQAGEPEQDEGTGQNETAQDAKDGRQAAISPSSRFIQNDKNGSDDDVWVKKEYLLFDLDGTLTDPKIGITTCVQHALKEFGIEEPDLDKLEPFIGPPLKDSFMNFYHFTPEQAQKAVEKYRERFQDKGIFENEIYQGIPQMLKKLKARGMHLGVASSKPTVFVEKILEHFGIREYFEVVVGSELDGTRSKKEEVVQEALGRLFHGGTINRQKVLMIGDRKFDTEGAKAAGIESVGVAFGYGSMEELMEAHTDYIVRSVEELRRFLLRGYEDMEKDLTPFQKMWVLIYHLVLFTAVRGLVQSLGGNLLRTSGKTEMTPDLASLLVALGCLFGGAAIFRSAKRTIKRTIRDMYLTHLKWDPKAAYVEFAVAAIGLSQGIAMLMSLTGFVDKSQAFQQVVEHQAATSLLVAFFTSGLVAPIAEELLFRGIIYGYVRRFFDVRTAVVGSAILFGIYHGNMVQSVYAVLMGYLIAYAYEYFGEFKVPLLAHMGINILAILISYTGLAATGFTSWPVCVALLILGGGALYFMARRKKVL